MDKVEKGERHIFRHKQWKQCERTKQKREKKRIGTKGKIKPRKTNTKQYFSYNQQKGLC